MPVFKNEANNSWYVMARYTDWKGERRQKCKRGFQTRREAQEWEHTFQMQTSSDMDMSFEAFAEIYTRDIKPRLKETTWLTKKHIIRTKLLPSFGKRKLSEISTKDVIAWQNELLAHRDEQKKPYSAVYLKTMHNQLSAIFNHAVRFYGLRNNPAAQAGNMGAEQRNEMLFWTKEEYQRFAEAMMDKPASFYAFEMLYWCGIREGELLALTPADFDFEAGTVRINKSYQRLHGEDVITTPKTKKSNRTIKMPQFLCDEMQDYLKMLCDLKKKDRIFTITKSYLHHEMDRGAKEAGVKRIRIHDLRHSHISLLIDMGFSAVAIADRVGHESIRFIAVSDGVDSEDDAGNDFTPFRNIINEWYCRDVSKKIKASMRARAQAGQHLTGFAPYGYIKSKEDKNKWLVDEEAAAIVREIFQRFIGGQSASEIAQDLNRRGLLPPREYSETKHDRPAYGKYLNMEKPPVVWRLNAILTIVDRYEYCGHTVSCKSVSASYKSKKHVRIPKDEWLITRDTQPPIIDEETWMTAHRIRESGKRKPEGINEKGPLNGFLFCAGCHNKLHFHSCPRLKNTNGTFDCFYHTSYKLCTSHYIHRNVVEEAVLADLQRVTCNVREHEQEFLRLIQQRASSAGKESLRKLKKEQSAGEKRLDDIDRIINRLYEDKVAGELSAERFGYMLATYEEEQAALRTRLEELRIAIAAEHETTDAAEHFVRLVKKYSEITELTDEIVATFIQRVEVHEPVRLDGQKHQEITVYYNFIGNMGK